MTKRAKNDATYDVVPGGTYVLDQFRGDRVSGTFYRIIKTPQFGYPTEYKVTFSTLGEWCDCPGGLNHGKCKHVGMVHDYLAREISKATQKEDENEQENKDAT